MFEPIISDLDEDTEEALVEIIRKSTEITEMFGETPRNIIRMIKEQIDIILTKDCADDELKEYAVRFGVTWGCLVVNAYSWRWKNIDFGDGDGFYVVSPKNYYCCDPFFLMDNILQGDNTGPDGVNENTVESIFLMLEGIEEKKPSGKYQIIS